MIEYVYVRYPVELFVNTMLLVLAVIVIFAPALSPVVAALYVPSVPMVMQ